MKRILLIIIGFGLLVIIGLALPSIYLSNTRSYTQVTIPANGYDLAGYLSEGSKEGGHWIIFFHGNRREGEAHPLYQQILNNLPEEAGVLAIDFRGFAGSADENLANSQEVFDRGEDIQAAAAYLADQKGVNDDQIILIGHSFGAAQVAHAAHDRAYKLVIPIGLGDWQTLLANSKQLMAYLRKIEENTGVSVPREKVIEEGTRFTPQAITDPCPLAPIVFVFAGFDDGKKPMQEQYQKKKANCPTLAGWEIVPFANHTYGTEPTRLPGFLQNLYSKIELSYLIWRLDKIFSGNL
jgi:pimeloyl-ACP methyl ester carboxylesterase